MEHMEILETKLLIWPMVAQHNYSSYVNGRWWMTGHKTEKKHWANAVGDIGTGFSARVTHNYAPCLTASRSRSNGYWIFSRWRRFTLQEFYRLQGMPADRLVLPHGVTERQMRGMVGNGWTVTVVASIFDRMLHVCGSTERPRGFELGSGEPGTIWG